MVTLNSLRWLALALPWAAYAQSAPLPSASRAASWTDSMGPLHSEFALTLASGRREEAAGPFYYHDQNDSQSIWAVPPLFSYTTDPRTDFSEFDLLYPLLTYDRFGEDYRWQLLQVLSLSGSQTQSRTNVSRTTIFPLYFQQRSADSAQNYTALVPFYGHLRNRLFKDEIFFAAFPLYSRTRKKDVVTDNYLYPVFHKREGDGLTGWQAWPLVGHEEKVLTYRTNSLGQVESVGGHDRWFALWPLFFEQQNQIGTTNAQTQHTLLPLYTISHSAQRDSATYLWPFGLTLTEDREKKYREKGFPWPLFVIARGEGKTTTRFWPIYSHAQNATQRSDFLLWPIYTHRHFTSAPADWDRVRILFFLYSDVKEKNTETGNTSRRQDFWPLFSKRRDLNGNERLQVLTVLEPLLPGSKSIERNYSQLWSLWRQEKNAKTGAISQSLLWNLYRREETPKSKKNSLLFGIFKYESGPQGKQWRLFNLPVKQSAAAAAEETTQP